jgi:hypothetical protein
VAFILKGVFAFNACKAIKFEFRAGPLKDYDTYQNQMCFLPKILATGTTKHEVWLSMIHT